MVHPGLLFFRGSLGAVVEFVFLWFGIFSGNAQILWETRSGRGLELAGTKCFAPKEALLGA